MRRNPHLQEYYTRNKSLPVVVALFLLIAIGYFLSADYFTDDKYSIETINGLAIGSQTRERDGASKNYLEVLLDSEREVLLLLPGHVDVLVGKNVEVIKTQASKESGLKYNYRFSKYLSK